jgi:hypothetical protein
VAFTRGPSAVGIPLDFARIEPLVVAKKLLSGERQERVDTRVLQVLYTFAPPSFPVHVGQVLDVSIEDTSAAPQAHYPTTSTSITANGTTTLSWSAVNDPEGLTPTYRVTASNGSTVETTSTSVSFPGLTPGTYTFTVTALNPNDLSKTSTPSSPSPSVRSLSSAGDDDGDGQANADELIAGTDPLNANSRFAIETILATPTGTTLTWTRVVGRTYTVEARDDLSSGVWVPIATGLTNGSYTDSAISSPSRRFYRIVVQ